MINPFLDSKSPFEVNPLCCHILQSNSNVDKVYPYYKSLLQKGCSPKEARSIVFSHFGLTSADFTASDYAKFC